MEKAEHEREPLYLVIRACLQDGNVPLVTNPLVAISAPPFLLVLIPHFDAALPLLDALLLSKLLPPASHSHFLELQKRAVLSQTHNFVT